MKGLGTVACACWMVAAGAVETKPEDRDSFEKTDKDVSLRPVKIVSPPPAKYRDPANIHYQTGLSVAVAPNGRIWVAVMTGGNWECNDNYVDLLTSGDGGQTWSEPKLALDIAGPLRTFDPAMWTDFEGRVWLCPEADFIALSEKMPGSEGNVFA